MSSRWQHDRPMSRGAFDARFPDEEACARYFAAKRWPAGFVCPACGVCKGWELETKSFTWECSGCHRQTSVRAGTVMHRSKLPLRTWFEPLQRHLGRASAGADSTRYRRLALAALKPMANPTEAMIDAAHEAVWFDAAWAVNSRRDFRRAVKAMFAAAVSER